MIGIFKKLAFITPSSDRTLYLIINDFQELNFLAPIIIYLNKNKISYQLIITFKSLKNKKKIEFVRFRQTILNLPFIKEGDPLELSSGQLYRFVKKARGVIVSCSGTIYRLLAKGKNSNCKYIVISYWTDRTAEIITLVDEVYVSGKEDFDLLKFRTGTEFDENKVKLGNPYWDLFNPEANEFDFKDLLQVSFPPARHRFLIPQIISDGETWFQIADKWISKYYSTEDHFYFKYRLKTQTARDRTDEFISKWPQSNISHVRDPFFFTNRALIEQATEVVFTSNRTGYSYECALFNRRFIKYYEKNTDFGIHNVHGKFIDKYLKSPKEATNFAITNHESNTEFFVNNVLQQLL